MLTLPANCGPRAARPAREALHSLLRSPRRPTSSRRRVWAPAADGGGAAAEGGVPGFLQNPGIAKRELLRQFYMAATSEEQLQLLQQASLTQSLDLGTRCGSLLGGTASSNIVPLATRSLQMLCHTADLSQKGLLPGSLAQQERLVRTLHSGLETALPALQPLHLATALWSYAVIGLPTEWTDDLLQQVARQELAAGRLEQYSTKELSSLLYAYGRLSRLPTPEVRQYGALLAGELSRRWSALPYVRSGFTSKDFADLAQACAALWGSGGGTGSTGSSSGSRSGNGALVAGAVGSACGPPTGQPVPAAVAALLDDLAGEVRRRLANKHSLRSPWTPRDLVRLAQAYAALGHRTPRAAQLLDVLSSFCVQRIASRHLNCVSRPEDLAGLLEAYADLGHVSVVVPELLTAAGEQVRRGAARRHEEQAAAGPGGGGAAAQPGAQQQQRPAEEGCSLAVVNSLLDSHLRLGFCPHDMLLQSLAPQIWRQVPAGSAAEAATMLQLLAALGLHPGEALVGLLLGRVADEAGGDPAAAAAARHAADALLHCGSSSTD